MLLEAGRHGGGAAESLVGQLGGAACAHAGCVHLRRPGRVLAHRAAAAAGAGAARPLSRQAVRRLRQEPAVPQWRRVPRGRRGRALALQHGGDVVQEVCEELAHTLVACGEDRQTARGAQPGEAEVGPGHGGRGGAVGTKGPTGPKVGAFMIYREN